MKRFITLLAAALMIGCTSDDTTPIASAPVELGTNESIYKIVDTNIYNLTVKRFRDSIWESKPEWANSRMIPVKDYDKLLITSSGETTTADKQLFLSYTGDGVTGTAEALQIGQELIWEDVIGKPY